MNINLIINAVKVAAPVVAKEMAKDAAVVGGVSALLSGLIRGKRPFKQAAAETAADMAESYAGWLTDYPELAFGLPIAQGAAKVNPVAGAWIALGCVTTFTGRIIFNTVKGGRARRKGAAFFKNETPKPEPRVKVNVVFDEKVETAKAEPVTVDLKVDPEQLKDPKQARQYGRKLGAEQFDGIDEERWPEIKTQLLFVMRTLPVDAKSRVQFCEGVHDALKATA